jgi:catechol 2,3-dioxygenase-like lactoylglutathione lyase family enzyme
VLVDSAANVTLSVRDLPASVRFYTETLGLELAARHGDHWAEVRAPGVTIGLHPGRGPADAALDPTAARAPDGDVSIGFVVSDFDGVVAGLEERGITTRVTNTPRARSAYFADLDGHSLYVMWRAS